MSQCKILFVHTEIDATTAPAASTYPAPAAPAVAVSVSTPVTNGTTIPTTAHGCTGTWPGGPGFHVFILDAAAATTDQASGPTTGSHPCVINWVSSCCGP